MMLLRVVLALLVAGSGFLFVRRTRGGRARGYGLMLSVSVIVLAMLGALTMDASEGGREEHAFRTTVAG
jgi:hypothetical protein